MALLCRILGHKRGLVPYRPARRRLLAMGVTKLDWWAGPMEPGCPRCGAASTGEEGGDGG